jgi:hypothetical protein
MQQQQYVYQKGDTVIRLLHLVALTKTQNLTEKINQ